MRDDLDGDPPLPGRALVETGELVAGSMSRAVAGMLFDPGSSPLRLDDRLTSCLAEAATAAAALTPTWERARAGAALAFAVELAATREHQGRRVRTDGFLTAGGTTRSPAEQLVEAVLRAARDAPEERRVRHLGYLFAEVAVSPDLDVELAGRVLRTAGRCGWRQLVLLAAVGRRERTPLPLTPLPSDAGAWTAWGAGTDLAELRAAGLLDPPPATPRPGGAAQPRLRPADLRLTRAGVLVHRLLALDFVRDDEVAAALTALGTPPA
ncbi:hypothetical protein GB931_13930 [Modestobacter sp. I12A-02628]|uniref:Uncharacterized protein n=1 Tax=Goekera deserti TaxID=2497753 RepID=A0A7K3WHA3_9ACTN|nr:hypothetical protein [Goekera deserti]MPQ99001.1 hypothetical protein [Goekera deserti]NDI47335.1 hypothetical protein [Goekera deserti]NEL55865.1 hypothetical protein [Goekera deserti]